MPPRIGRLPEPEGFELIVEFDLWASSAGTDYRERCRVVTMLRSVTASHISAQRVNNISRAFGGRESSY